MLLSLLLRLRQPSQKQLTALAQSALAAQGTSSRPFITLSFCSEAEAIISGAPELRDYERAIQYPAVSVSDYVHQNIKKHPNTVAAHVSVLKTPIHGVLKSYFISPEGGPSFMYTPNRDYLGQDKIVWRIEIEGKVIELIQSLQVKRYANIYGEGEPAPKCFNASRAGG